MERREQNLRRSRWTEDLLRRLNATLERGPAISSPFGVVDGRQDLRGVTVQTIITRRRLESLDLSYSIWELPGQLVQSQLADCRLDFSDAPANLGQHFDRCTFRSAHLTGRILRGRFQSCDFTDAKLFGAGATAVRFDGCSFRGANLRKAHLQRCVFVTCDFANADFGLGSLSGSSFSGPSLAAAQLGNTILDGVSWSHAG